MSLLTFSAAAAAEVVDRAGDQEGDEEEQQHTSVSSSRFIRLYHDRNDTSTYIYDLIIYTRKLVAYTRHRQSEVYNESCVRT